MSVDWPSKPPDGWWMRIFEFGSASRFSGAPPASSSAPMLIATPTQIVCTAGFMYCIVS
jgi:hypothetical protein